jgi:hypothetical protein
LISLIFLILSQIADLTSTLYGLQHGLIESNVLLRDLPTSEFTIIKYLVCMIALLMWLLFRRTRWALFVQCGFLGAGIITTGIAIHNLSLVI